MWLHSLINIILFSLLLITPTTKAARSSSAPKNAVLLSSISSLTLRAGRQTSARRSSPIPQVACIGPPEICKLYTVDTVRCTNAGSDYDEGNVQWTCTAELPEEFKFGSTDVSCEGFTSPDDPYVLKGSCGVEYRLLLTEKGEEKYGKYVSKNNGRTGETGETASDLVKALFLIIFTVVLLIIVFSFCSNFRSTPRRGGRNATFGGHGGGGGDDDPPPPYDYGPPPRKTTRSSYSSTRGNGARQEQWRPGFWTGALGGAAAGYVAGSRNRPQQPEIQQRGRGVFGGGDGGVGNPGGSSWFGGGGGNAGVGSSRSNSSSPPAASSSRYTSTGFGSTTRR